MRISIVKVWALLALCTLVSIGGVAHYGGAFFFAVLSAVLFVFQVALFPGRVTPATRIAVIVLMPLMVLSLSANLPTLTSTDSDAFIFNYSAYSLEEMLEETTSQFNLFSVGMVSARFTFPMMLKVFTGNVLTQYPAMILFLNMNIWVCASFLLVHVVEKQMIFKGAQDRDNIINVTFLVYNLFPSPLYWLSALNKDIISVAIPVISVFFFLNRSYLLSVFLLVVGSFVRPYTVIVFTAIWVLCAQSNRRIILAIFGVLLIMVTYSVFDLFLFANAILGFLFFFISPNPASSTNWNLYLDTGTWAFSPAWLTFESLLLLLVVIMSAFIYLLVPQSRADYRRLLGAIFLISSAVVFVGYFRMNETGMDFAIGNFGDNLVRKKMSAWPLISLFVAYTLSFFMVRTGGEVDIRRF